MITELRRLWQQAFGDSDAFLDNFFRTGYAAGRCRYLAAEGRVTAMLYWFDCTLGGRKLAYLYAIATDKAWQNQGLCRKLMSQTHDHLRASGYAGALLVPGDPSLFSLYEKIGYRTCSFVTETTCTAGTPTMLQPLDVREYAALRRQYLPDKGVVQEGATLDFLSCFAQFYQGNGFVLAATAESGHGVIHELLGSADPCSVIAALGAVQGRVRTPGPDKPFAMFYSLDGSPAPAYFGLALD